MVLACAAGADAGGAGVGAWWINAMRSGCTCGGGVGSVLLVALPLPLVSFRGCGVVVLCFPRAEGCIVLLVALPLSFMSLAGGGVVDVAACASISAYSH